MVKLAMGAEQRAARTPGGTRIVLRGALLLVVLALALPAFAAAEQASQPSSPAASQLDAGGQHSCALVASDVRCWGLGFTGQLGYANKDNIGDNETPGSVGPVNIGPNRTATAISAGDSHTCALLDGGTVRCWGFGGDGRLGYGNENTIGDNETPDSVGTVSLGRPATAISAGGAHTCALLDDRTVRCWGFGEDGRLGYGVPPGVGDDDPATVGDDETPDSIGPVSLGGPATAISTGGSHTCALLADGNVRCWGTNGTLFGGDGRLGYGNGATIGDNETPDSVDPVKLGTGRTATAISAGDFHTCAVLDGGDVRCWGNGQDGRLGYGNEFAVGDNETPDMRGPVQLGGVATAISAGNHTCARLSNGTVRCWGPGASGRLGYGNTNDIGDTQTKLPSSAGPVELGAGRTATAISAGGSHTCASLDNAVLRCWGEGDHGRLGYGNQRDIGDDETPAAAGPVDFRPRVSIDDRTVSEGSSGERTVTFTVRLSSSSRQAASVAYATASDSARAPADYAARSGRLAFAPGETSKTVTVRVKGDTLDEPNERFFVNLSSPINLIVADPRGMGTIVDDDARVYPLYGPPAPDAEAVARRAQESRRRAFRTCVAKAKRHTRREIRRARGLKAARRSRARRHAKRHASRLRRACLKRWGRTPGRVTGLKARALSRTRIVLTFKAAGTHGSRPPAARTYLVKQSRRPIRGSRGFRRAETLCRGSCRFSATARVGATLTLRVIDLRPRATYYYSVVARDNVSRMLGPRSRAARARTR